MLVSLLTYLTEVLLKCLCLIAATQSKNRQFPLVQQDSVAQIIHVQSQYPCHHLSLRLPFLLCQPHTFMAQNNSTVNIKAVNSVT